MNLVPENFKYLSKKFSMILYLTKAQEYTLIIVYTFSGLQNNFVNCSKRFTKSFYIFGLQNNFANCSKRSAKIVWPEF